MTRHPVKVPLCDDDSTGPDWTAGLAALEHHAHTGRVFSSNDADLRTSLRDLGFTRYTTGRLWQLAETAGLIRQVGVEKSTDPRTRGAFVRRWTGAAHPPSAETITVPVQRDRGRFTSSAQTYTDVPLPMEVTR